MTVPSLGSQATASFHIGAKGRVVLPAALRRAARLDEGTELVARLVGDGQLLLETKDAVRARVWGGAASGAGVDTTADVRAMRTADAQLEADNASRREQSGSDADSEAAGASLLARLGL